MTTPTPELVTAEQANEMLIDLKVSKAQPTDWFPIHDAAPDLARTVIALHEALAAANAKIAELEAGASRSLFALMTDRALAAEARADAAEARVAVLEPALKRAADQLSRVHDDAFTQCAGLALVRSDGKAFSCMEINRCDEVARKSRAALETGAGDES